MGAVDEVSASLNPGIGGWWLPVGEDLEAQRHKARVRRSARVEVSAKKGGVRMKSMVAHSIRLLLMAGLAGAMLPAQSVGAQDETQTIVYARSTGDSDIPKENEIFAMQADGSDPLQLTDNAKEDAFPNLSPDKTQIAFSRRIKGQFDLFILSIDGSKTTRLTRTGNADEVLPTWSPDGEKLAFTVTTSTPDGWQSDIYRMRVSDGRYRRLTYTPIAKEFAPDWSPDGEEIAFTKQAPNSEKYGVAIVKPDTSGLRWLVINPESASGYTDVNPTWSPDSEWIAFSRDHGSDPYVDIYKIKRDGTEVTAVTELNELAENPVWGADGRILFMHNEGLAVVPSEGGDVEHLTPTKTGLPYWWPDW
jgi:Tol biopolymer transport system component